MIHLIHIPETWRIVDFVWPYRYERDAIFDPFDFGIYPEQKVKVGTEATSSVKQNVQSRTKYRHKPYPVTAWGFRTSGYRHSRAGDKVLCHVDARVPSGARYGCTPLVSR